MISKMERWAIVEKTVNETGDRDRDRDIKSGRIKNHIQT